MEENTENHLEGCTCGQCDVFQEKDTEPREEKDSPKKVPWLPRTVRFY
ncbi:hypothetical protein HQ403_01095 [Candidatus Kaiserbacteria bacterium]|nr:hypothetical protein [Candidatus Kaiserbacteria bacterium]